jgi:hypothetical protein
VAPDCGLRSYTVEPSSSPLEALSEAMSDFQREGVIETRKTFILDRETRSQHASGPPCSSADGQILI